MRGFGPNRKKGILCLIAAALLLIFSLALINNRLFPAIEQVAENQIQFEVNDIVNNSVKRQMATGTTYQDLVIIEKNDQNQITLLRQNTPAINALISAITLDINNDLKDLSLKGVTVPLGLLSGFPLFANYGPTLKVKIQTMNSVDIQIQDSFTSVGLNQSRHTLYLESNVSVSLLLPFRQQLLAIHNTFPITDSIIVGPLPQTYLQLH